MSEVTERLVIVLPVYDDWESLLQLLSDFNLVRGLPEQTSYVIVDDGSSRRCRLDAIVDVVGSRRCVLVELGTNLGHQRAIAVGLVTVALDHSAGAAIVMDADGEDKPSDCVLLWNAHLANTEQIIVAQRRGRSESFRFKTFYEFYKILFRCLTGLSLNFGNFSLLPAGVLQRVVQAPDLWNHYPATVMKSRQPVVRIPLTRGSRLFGRSRMNFIGLVNHGMAGIAVFADRVYARLLAITVGAVAVLTGLILAVVVYRLILGSPLPGWFALGATVAFVALFQVGLALLVVSFLNLSLRSQPLQSPTKVAPGYVVNTTVLEPLT